MKISEPLIETQILDLWAKLTPEARRRVLGQLKSMLDEPSEGDVVAQEIQAAFDKLRLQSQHEYRKL